MKVGWAGGQVGAGSGGEGSTVGDCRVRGGAGAGDGAAGVVTDQGRGGGGTTAGDRLTEAQVPWLPQ